ncbi:class I SAM-dependent methyltransferase [Amycolatopsis sp. AA4]|uniref:class I SAM-dependent methyltransferase n=1 Tax=Actinomycetes TaxID=1760 RepID=UPI00055BBB1C|nr:MULTISPECIES: class I SAM-dependent methyltransferase [Actinomycetes]ATY12722.1 class I SAM-dependent methyltransferase [Amycolatopsis sp. AA4]
MTERALSFGAVAAEYERYRPGYPAELAEKVLDYAGAPIAEALEIGAGTGKATRLFAGWGIAVTATDPDPAMLAELRKHLPAEVETREGALEDLRPDRQYGLVYSAAALHWTDPAGRWPRIAALLAPGGVFASFGGPVRPADPVVRQAIDEAQAPFLESAGFPPPDGTPPESELQWPGTELEKSELFADVRQVVVQQRLTLSADELIGLLSTVSAYRVLPISVREQVFPRIRQVLPETVELVADHTAHLARRR